MLARSLVGVQLTLISVRSRTGGLTVFGVSVNQPRGVAQLARHPAATSGRLDARPQKPMGSLLISL